MKKKPKQQSPLERLVKAAQDKEKREKAAREQNLPVKLEPKSRFPKKKPVKILMPLVEDEAILLDSTETPNIDPQSVVIANSSLTLNFSFNMDDKAVDRAFEASKKVAKGIAAAGAAMLGTAFLLNKPTKTVDKVKIPLIPKVKVPKIKKKA